MRKITIPGIPFLVDAPDYDTGVGAHLATDTSPFVSGDASNNYAYEANLAAAKELVAHGISHVKVIGDGGEQSIWYCRALVDAGLMVTLRAQETNPSRGYTIGRAFVRGYKAVGVRHFEFGNEINLGDEGGGSIEVVCLQIKRNVEIIAQEGCVALLPSVTAGTPADVEAGAICLETIFAWFKANDWAWFKGHCDAGDIEVAGHYRDLNKPLDYPDDSVNRLGIPLTPEEIAAYKAELEEIKDVEGLRTLDWFVEYIDQRRTEDKNPTKSLAEDDACFRAYELAIQVCMKYLGYKLPVRGTEMGPVIGDGDDPRFLKTMPHGMAAKVIEMVRRLNRKHPKAWDPALQEIDLWYWSMNGHYAFPEAAYIDNPLRGGNLPVVAALARWAKSPENVDRWDGVVVPPTPEPEPGPVPEPEPVPEPTPVPAGNRNKWGSHLPNGPLSNDAVWRMGVDNYTFLHPQADYAVTARAVSPHGILLCRFYLPNWWAKNPLEWARECAHEYTRERVSNGQSYTLSALGVHVTAANEQNLALEGGGWEEGWYVRINEWNLIWVAEFRRLTGCPVERIHFPAFAYGHSDDLPDLGYVGMEICRPAIEACGVLDVHPYWIEADQVTSEFYGHRFKLAHALFPDMPIFCSELGNFDVIRGSSPDEFIQWFESIDELPYVLAGTPFIWEDPTRNFERNDWSRNGEIARRVTAHPKRLITTPIEEEPMPEDNLTTVLHNMWTRQGAHVPLDDGFFKHAIEQARTNGVYIIPQPSPDGNYTLDLDGYRIAYTMPPMYAKLGDWGNVKTGLPF